MAMRTPFYSYFYYWKVNKLGKQKIAALFTLINKIVNDEKKDISSCSDYLLINCPNALYKEEMKFWLLHSYNYDTL